MLNNYVLLHNIYPNHILMSSFVNFHKTDYFYQKDTNQILSTLHVSNVLLNRPGPFLMHSLPHTSRFTRVGD